MNKYFTQFNAFIAPYGLEDPHILQLNQLCEVVSMNKGEVVIKSGLKVNCIYQTGCLITDATLAILNTHQEKGWRPTNLPIWARW